MVLITSEENPTRLTTSIDALARQLAEMREELEERYKQIRAGNFSGLEDSKTAVADIRQWLRIALEAEVQLEKRRKQEQGLAGGYGIDFDAARAEVGCRLDRLRRSRCPGRVHRRVE
ncbi:MAG: hypothetical protein RI571_04570 [Roseovarius sp.]|nr:hypothetical protein [Roseovarius sp.]